MLVIFHCYNKIAGTVCLGRDTVPVNSESWGALAHAATGLWGEAVRGQETGGSLLPKVYQEAVRKRRGAATFLLT